MDFGRGVPIRIELLQGDLQNFCFRQLRASFRDELDALEHAAAANLKNLHDRAGGTKLHAERVAISELDAGHFLLSSPQRLNGTDGIAKLRGLFEALGGRRFRHAIAQAGQQFVVAPFEKEARVLDRRPILRLAAERADARRHAALDVVLQARPTTSSR